MARLGRRLGGWAARGRRSRACVAAQMLSELESAVAAHPAWRTAEAAELANALEGIEADLMRAISSYIFAVSDEDVHKSSSLEARTPLSRTRAGRGVPRRIQRATCHRHGNSMRDFVARQPKQCRSTRGGQVVCLFAYCGACRNAPSPPLPRATSSRTSHVNAARRQSPPF